MPNKFFLYTFPLKSSGIVESANLFQRILSLYAFFENTPKEFYRSQRIRQKYLIIFGNCAKSL
jgi:hypothetical protein